MRREATICAGRPISAPAVAKPQHDGSWRAPTNAPVCRSDSNHMRRRGAKSFVDDLVLSRGVVLSRADLFCDLLRLSPMTRRFVRFRRTYLRRRTGGGHRAARSVASERIARGATFCRLVPVCMPDGPPDRRRLQRHLLHASACMPDGPRGLPWSCARSLPNGRFVFRGDSLANRCHRVAAAKNDKFCLACRTARGMHAGRPVSLACRTARDAGSL